MKTIIILGANGKLGRAVMRAFLPNGYRVVAVTRNGQLHDAPLGIEQRAADAMNAEKLAFACRDADFILNALNPPYTEWRHKALPIAQHVIAAALEHRATHLFPGNVYNYGSGIPAICTPQTPFHGNTRKGQIRIEMEALFANAAQQYAVQTLILRAGDFYGGGKGSWFDQITAKLDKGVFTYPGSLDKIHSWAYLPDLAQAFVLLAEQCNNLSAFESFLFSGHSLTGADLQTLLQSICGQPLKTETIPWWLIKMGGLVVPIWRELPELAYLWQRPHTLADTRLDKIIGNLQLTPPIEALKQALAARKSR